ncbi:MAG: hypothetical protein ACE5J3_12115, partial [Methanosarcinales archaeon]
MTLGDFAELYFTTFIRQYLGFYLKDPEIAKNKNLAFEDLKEFASKAEKIKKVSNAIEGFKKIKPVEDNWTKMWMYAQEAPSWIGDITGTYVAVILDEFQDLDNRIYMDKEYKILKDDITGGFASVCSKKSAPMLVSGSLVTIVTRKVFGGPLGGRFGAIHLELMSIKDGMKLAFKLSNKYNVEVKAETAQLISEISQGNPYYIWCAFVSEKENKDLTTVKGVEEVYKFEVTDRRGKIRDFWDEHFKMNLDLLNANFKKGLNQKIIFYILKNRDRSVSYKEIARKFKIRERSAYEVLDNLLKADLVTERAYGIVRGLKDSMLERCLKVIFKPIIEEIDEIIVAEEVSKEVKQEIEKLKNKLKSMQGYINTIVGEEAEIMIKRVMNKFNNQEVDGTNYFNLTKKIILPKFDRKPHSRVIIGEYEDKYQIDFYGKKTTKKDKIIWIGESKNWNKQVGKEVVEALINKIELVKREENTDKVIGWLYSKNGFEKDALNLMQEKDILGSDKNNLISLMEFLGIL